MSQKSHALHISASRFDVLEISASKLRLLKISAMRVTLKRSTHQISASGTDFAYISVTVDDKEEDCLDFDPAR